MDDFLLKVQELSSTLKLSFMSVTSFFSPFFKLMWHLSKSRRRVISTLHFRRIRPESEIGVLAPVNQK
jgi:hypothetical protein